VVKNTSYFYSFPGFCWCKDGKCAESFPALRKYFKSLRVIICSAYDLRF
jgi:hypothetical protein